MKYSHKVSNRLLLLFYCSSCSALFLVTPYSTAIMIHLSRLMIIFATPLYDFNHQLLLFILAPSYYDLIFIAASILILNLLIILVPFYYHLIFIAALIPFLNLLSDATCLWLLFLFSTLLGFPFNLTLLLCQIFITTAILSG